MICAARDPGSGFVWPQAASGGRRRSKVRLQHQSPPFTLNNYLDPESVNALNIRLQKYDGTLLPLTHDHDVVEEVATWIWSIDPGKIEDFLAKKESARA